MRQLASIQRVKALAPIEGADAILRATVLGWQLVVKKGEFDVGDLGVYVEIDARLPDRPEFEFLRPRGMRIRTIRLRGQISQGILFPLDILPPGTPIAEGLDVTEALGVVKYEPPIDPSLAGVAKGPFPSFLPKTDETRVQVLQDVLDAFAGTPCAVTEKLDGSSTTYFAHDGAFGVCSRNLELLDVPGDPLWQWARENDVEARLRALGRSLALQGELVGPGVHGNKYGLPEKTVRFFNVFDVATYTYLGHAEAAALLSTLALPMVPVLDEAYVLPAAIPDLVERARVRSTLNPAVWAEGIVVRPLEERTHPVLGRVSFKSINPEFLLKYE